MATPAKLESCESQVILKDFVIRCSAEHSTHPALDNLVLVINGQIDEDGMSMEKISKTEWRCRGSIELRGGMDKLSFVVQAKDSKDLGHVSLIRDELVQFFAVRDNITIEHKFEPLKSEYPSLWITFTVGVGMSNEIPTNGPSSVLPDIDTELEQLIAMESMGMFPGFSSHLESANPERLNLLGDFLMEKFQETGKEEDIERAILAYKRAARVIPSKHPMHITYITDWGQALLAQFQLLGDLDNIHHIISMLGQGVHSAAEDDDGLSRCLVILGFALDSRFRHTGDLADLEKSISNLQRAVELTPHGHAELPSRFNDLGAAFKSHFNCTGNHGDLENAIFNLQRAVELTPDDHPDKPSYLNSLGHTFQSHFRCTGDLADIENAISNHQHAVKLTPHGHPKMPTWLNNLGAAFNSRFHRTGDLDDLENVISNLQHAAKLTPDGHPNMSSGLNNIGTAFNTRFNRTGDLDDLENAISNLQRAVELTPHSHPNMPAFLHNLGQALHSRFGRTGNLADLENIISNFQCAVKLTPDSHREMPLWLKSLGSALQRRFDYTGNHADIENAISNLRHAIELTPHGHPNMPSNFKNLGSAFTSRFCRTGDPADIENAISNLQNAVKLTPDGHTDMPLWLESLGSAFQSRFDCTGNHADIENAISNFQHAIELTPHGHPDMPSNFNNLGSAFTSRFRCTGDPADIENAISNLQRSIELTPYSHANKSIQFNDLGTAFESRFRWTGDLSDLENAISNLQCAVKLTPDGHTGLPTRLSNLGTAFKSQFGRTGDLADLENAISNLQRAIELTPDGHTDMPSRLSNLGSAFKSRFDHTGDLVDLENAISNFHRAIELTPDSHTKMPIWLSNLGSAFKSRFHRTVDLDDLENAIFNLQRAVDLTPPGHPMMPIWLNNLGGTFQSRFDCTDNLSNLESAISSLQQAIELTPHGHTELPSWLSNLGTAFSSRFGRTGNHADIENAISNLQRAVDLTPPGHPKLPLRLNNLGGAFRSRFDRTADLADLENVISNAQRCIDLTPYDHANMPLQLNNLGYSCRQYFMHTQNPRYLEEAISAYRRSATHIISTPSAQFYAAQAWAELSQSSSRTDALEAFRVAVELLSQVAGLEQTVSKRYINLADVSHLTKSASAAAIDAGRNETALEWLEQGRCLVWNQIQQLRTPVEDLHAHDPLLANRFREVATALEASGSRQTKALLFSEGTLSQMIASQDENRKHVELAKEWQQLLDKIRAIHQFSDFLRPPTTSSLFSDLSSNSTVVIFNIHEVRCDAFALISGADEPIHIPLSTFSHKRATELYDNLCVYLKGKNVRMREDERAIRQWKRQAQGTQESVMHRVLRELWKDVVQPVFNALAYDNMSENLTDRPRIWWCPTGPLALLPLHAAGIYVAEGPRGPCISDFVVSSYTPTISILGNQIKPAMSTTDGTPTRLLLISQPSTPGLSSILGTLKETRGIEDMMEGQHIQSLWLNHDAATTARVTEEMQTHSWVHFACHAIQDKDPLKSGIHLYDRRLELLEMMKQKILQADHVFLSACQTGTGDEKLSDEVAHIAAGMLAVGYRGVVGTMWSISDARGPEIAHSFYEHILNASGENVGNGRLDSSCAARALDHSTREIRKKDGDTERALLTWVPYVHFGL